MNRRLKPSAVSVLVILLGTAAGSTSASAQTCLGALEFTRFSWQLGGNVGTGWGPTSALGAGGRLTLGNRWMLAGIDAGYIRYGDLEYSQNSAGVMVGAVMPVKRHAALCPIFSYERSLIENFGPEADFSSLSATTTVGVAFGVPVRSTKRLRIVPTSTLAYHHVHTLIEVIGPESDQSGYVTNVQVGVGFVIQQRVSLIPTLTFAVAMTPGWEPFTSFRLTAAVKLR